MSWTSLNLFSLSAVTLSVKKRQLTMINNDKSKNLSEDVKNQFSQQDLYMDEGLDGPQCIPNAITPYRSTYLW